ncbi:nitroreductase family protein [Chloroflexota bacterium]
MIRDLITSNRTCRRFYQDEAIELETLRELVDLARLSASGSNRQPLRYILICDPEKNAFMFSCLGWAIFDGVRDPGPPEGERPSAYIIMLGDTEIAKNFAMDPGISCQSIFLGAREKGLGGTIHGSVKRKELIEALKIPEKYQIIAVLSLGKVKEKAVIDTVGPDGDIHYWRDSDDVHHVPKRSLDDMIIDQLCSKQSTVDS